MRIQNHFSIVLFVAVVGAIGLAAGVGLLLGWLEDATLLYGEATEQQEQVGALVTESQALLESVDGLTIRSSEESFAVMDRAIERSMANLARLRQTPLVFDPTPVGQALESLERFRRLAAERSGGVQHPELLDRLRAGAAQYVTTLRRVDVEATAARTRLAREVSRQRRIIMLAISVICIIYLAAIERVRHYTTRHLIDPMQRLADAARQAMRGGSASPRLVEADSEELKALAAMLDSYAESLKAGVHERTAQMAQQKEFLEQEVRLRRRTEQELRYAAFRDRLTGLCNRDLLMNRLEVCFQRTARREDYVFALLLIDVDEFKEANDAVGEIFGDHVMVAVAERFHDSLQSTAEALGIEAVTLARVGGDEFAVLLDGISDRDHAGLAAERFNEALAKPFEVQDRELTFTASIGIALLEEEVTSGQELMRNADAAMHFAKAGGRGRYSIFRPGMHDQVTAHEEAGARLRAALARGEFRVVYQPIIDLHTGRLCGFEALTRWDDPERGPVSPVEFIPDAEQTGLIVPLGRWVLDEACRQLSEWRRDLDEAKRLTVSVNVSSQQLSHADFVDYAQRVLRGAHLEPDSLKLEITESVIMENPDAIAKMLQRLKGLGIEIHMDDFGTGYSSLSYLHRLPIDVLKIDRAFLTSLSAETDYADVVHTVVALARTLKMRVTVEGVESEEQLAQLQALDCDYAQGYFFSRALSAEAARDAIIRDRLWLKAA